MPDLTTTIRDRLRAGALVLVVQDPDEALAVAAAEPAALAAGGAVEIVSAADDRAMGLLEEHPEGKGTLILLDFLAIYGENPVAVRLVRQVALQDRPDGAFSRLILIERPTTTVPAGLGGDVSVVVSTLPTVEDLTEELVAFLEAQADAGQPVVLEGNGETRYALASAGAGLARHEYALLLARCVVETGGLDATWLRREKARRVAVKLGGALTFEDADSAPVGGLANLRRWLDQRRAAFASQRARSFGLPEPKGVLIVGVPGGGKSLTARAVAQGWGLPLLRLDPGKLFGSLVGQSEAQARQAIEAAEACAPCVLWIDEVEKGLAGGTGGQGDSGTSSRVFGTILTWLQEKRSPVFVVATANRVEALPPELLRKGRFDDIFTVGLPSYGERCEIARIHLERRGRDLGDDAPQAIAEVTDGFVGAEIEAAVLDGLFAAYSEDRDLTVEDVTRAASATTPLSTTAKGDIEAIEAWAKGRARPASAPDDETTTPKPTRKARGRRRGPVVG